MAITSMDKLVEGLSAGEHLSFYKTAPTTTAGSWHSLWRVAGQPAAGAVPGTGAGEVPTRATAGALKFANPSSPALSYLATFAAVVEETGTLVLYDRLVQTSGLSGTSITAQTINSAAITRPDALGAGVELWLEVNTPTGITSRTVSVSYTNQDGTAGQVGTVTLPASPVAGRMFQVALASGDTGVRSVQSLTLSGSTGTAGDFGIVLLRRLAALGQAVQYTLIRSDAFALGLPRIYDDACLALMVLATGTAQGPFNGDLTLAKL